MISNPPLTTTERRSRPVYSLADTDLVDELLERCRLRQQHNPVWAGEAGIEKYLCDAGKLLVIRFPRQLDPTT